MLTITVISLFLAIILLFTSKEPGSPGPPGVARSAPRIITPPLAGTSRSVQLEAAPVEIVDLVTTPVPTDKVATRQVRMAIRHAAGAPLSGTTVLRVQGSNGTVMAEFEQPFEGLGPGEPLQFDAVWKPEKAIDDFQVTGYVLQGGHVSTSRRLSPPEPRIPASENRVRPCQVYGPGGRSAQLI